MEPPPRLYFYEGLFTTCRSIDLPLKVFFTLACFIVLLLIAAWHVSRKTCRRAPREMTAYFMRISDLFQWNLRDVFTNDWRGRTQDVSTVYAGRNTIILVNDWKLTSLYQQAPNLDCSYSAAPGRLRHKWCGLLLADSTLSNRSQLRSVLLHAFDGLPNNAYHSVGSLCSDPVAVSHYISGPVILDMQNLDAWVWFIVSEFVLFNSSATTQQKQSESLNIYKPGFLKQLKMCIENLEKYHVNGRMPSRCFQRADQVTSVTVGQLLTGLENLFAPLICYVTEQLMSQNQFTTIGQGDKLQHCGNLLSQLVCAYHQLESEGEYVRFMSVSSIVHSLAEISLILRRVLLRHFQVLFVVLAQRPKWQSHLIQEASASFTEDSKSRFDAVPISESLLLRQTHLFVWTKALVNETMRFCAPGWPFDCLRQALCDGHINNYDYLEGDLVLFNQPAYLSDQQLWVEQNGQSDSQLLFNPRRFIEYTVGTVPHLRLPVHWARFMLMGYAVSIPHETIYHLLTSVMLHLFRTGWRIPSTVDNEDLTDSPVRLDSALPFVPLQPPSQ